MTTTTETTIDLRTRDLSGLTEAEIHAEYVRLSDMIRERPTARIIGENRYVWTSPAGVRFTITAGLLRPATEDEVSAWRWAYPELHWQSVVGLLGRPLIDEGKRRSSARKTPAAAYEEAAAAKRGALARERVKALEAEHGGRVAKCACGKATASKPDLAFFEATEGLTDRFYCGCWGWD